MTDLTYLSLTDAIPTLDAILTSALHDRRRGDSDAMLYRRAVDAVALSGACYRVQRIALSLLRNELGIPDSIEDAKRVRTESPQCRTSSPSREERGVSGIRISPNTAEGVTAPIARALVEAQRAAVAAVVEGEAA